MGGENLDKDMHTWITPCEDDGRDQGDTSIRQGRSKIFSKLPEVRQEARNRFSSRHSEKNQPGNTLVLDI